MTGKVKQIRRALVFSLVLIVLFTIPAHALDDTCIFWAGESCCLHMLRNQLADTTIAGRTIQFHDPPMDDEGACHNYGGSSMINWDNGTVEQCVDYAYEGYNCSYNWRYLGCLAAYGCKTVVLNLGVNDVRAVYQREGRSMDDYVRDLAGWIDAREAEGHRVVFATEYPLDRDCKDRNGMTYDKCNYYGISGYGAFQEEPEDPVAVACSPEEMPGCGYENINTNYQYVIHRLRQARPGLQIVDMFNHVRETYTDSDLFVQEYSESTDGVHQAPEGVAGQHYWAVFVQDELEAMLPERDTDGDGFADSVDNCPVMPNGPDMGTCTQGEYAGSACSGDHACGSAGSCSMLQEDADLDGIGDACDDDDPPVLKGGPVVVGKWEHLSTDPGSRTVFPQDPSFLWVYSDDVGSCSEPCAHAWFYRPAGEDTWQYGGVPYTWFYRLAGEDTRQYGGVPYTAYIYVWIEQVRTLLGSGEYDFCFSITDCAGQSFISDTYYFSLS